MISLTGQTPDTMKITANMLMIAIAAMNNNDPIFVMTRMLTMMMAMAIGMATRMVVQMTKTRTCYRDICGAISKPAPYLHNTFPSPQGQGHCLVI